MRVKVEVRKEMLAHQMIKTTRENIWAHGFSAYRSRLVDLIVSRPAGKRSTVVEGYRGAGLFLNGSQEGVRRESKREGRKGRSPAFSASSFPCFFPHRSLPTRQRHLHSGSLSPLCLQGHMPIVFTNILIGIPRQ